MPLTPDELDEVRRAQGVANAALDRMLAQAGPGGLVDFTRAQTALLSAGTLPAPEWTLRRLEELAGEGRLVAAGVDRWRTPA